MVITPVLIQIIAGQAGKQLIGLEIKKFESQ